MQGIGVLFRIFVKNIGMIMSYTKSQIAEKLGVTVRTLVAYCRKAGLWKMNDRRKVIGANEAKNIIEKFGSME